MVSRKKAQGRARKAAKAERKSQEEEEVEAATNEQQPPPETQMQRRMIENILANNDAASCAHGHSPLPWGHVCAQFSAAYIRGFNEAYLRGDRNIKNCLNAAMDATEVNYVDVWADAKKMEIVKCSFLAMATKLILDGNIENARSAVAYCSHFEQHIAINFHKNQKASLNQSKIFELIFTADEHTLVDFLRKRIPCTCLDKKYEQVKHMTKMGWCSNAECSLPHRECERKKMFYCTQCRQANYCSPECQKADWPRHKEQDRCGA